MTTFAVAQPVDLFPISRHTDKGTSQFWANTLKIAAENCRLKFIDVCAKISIENPILQTPKSGSPPLFCLQYNHTGDSLLMRIAQNGLSGINATTNHISGVLVR